MVFVFTCVVWSILFSYKIVKHHTVSAPTAIRDSFCERRVDGAGYTLNDRLVVLRLDDVQATMWSKTSRMLIEGAIGKGVTMVAGVIPKGLDADVKMDSLLRRERCNIEVALHGWDHGRSVYTPGELDGPPEFSQLSADQAMPLLLAGKSVLEKRTDGAVTTFIPPNNQASDGAVEALKGTGFDVISSGGEDTFDYSIPTYDFQKQSIVPVDDVLTACNRKFSEGKFCVIMFHPQEYSNADRTLNDEVYRDHFLALIDRLKEGGASFTTFRELSGLGVHDAKLDSANQSGQ